jgi:hypothetical protein
MPTSSNVLPQLTSDACLEAAYEWLCRQRREHGANSSVWYLRHHWQSIKQKLQQTIRQGTFQLEPTRSFIDTTGSRREMREAVDALVLRALAQTLTLTPLLTPYIPQECTHVRGHGGAKGAITQSLNELDKYPFVFKTDVYHYYASIDHHLLMTQVEQQIQDKTIRDLIWQSIHRISWHKGYYHKHTRGIALGCPLSPLLGALYLMDVDKCMKGFKRCFYTRFMDDLLILAPNKPILRQVVKRAHQMFDALKLKMHPDKTFIGRCERGFEFLGYHIRFESENKEEKSDNQSKEACICQLKKQIEKRGKATTFHFDPPSFYFLSRTHKRKIRLKPTYVTWLRFLEHIHQLYEQDAGIHRIGDYISRWAGWFFFTTNSLLCPTDL